MFSSSWQFLPNTGATTIEFRCIGTITGGGLWLIGIKLWLTLGLLAALFNVIPNFGPLISFFPAFPGFC